MNILVTGGAGFIGSHLTHKLLDLGHSVTVFDSLETGSRSHLSDHKNLTFFEGNVNDIAQLKPAFAKHFDAVFHYAAVVGVARTLKNPLLVLADLKGIENILSLSAQTGVGRVFFSSSSEVYGEPVEYPQHEERTPLNARLPYAIVKSAGEAFMRSYLQEKGLSYTIFRFFNTYGIRQRPDFVVSKFMRQAIEGADITIYGDGEQKRSFCFIDDNIDATVACLTQNKYVNDTINIGNDHEVTMNELAHAIIAVTNSSSKIVHLPPLPEGDMRGRRPDITKMQTVMTKPLTPLIDGLTILYQSMGS